jgi:hypothetical protein
MNRFTRFVVCFSGCVGLHLFALILLLLSTSCSTTGQSHSFFRDGKKADVVLHFYRWDTIYMTRPDTRQSGFLPVLSRAQIERELRHRALPRNVAVVVIGHSYSPAQINTLTQEWKNLLGEQGFRRFILLRAGPDFKIDGLPVVEDSAISSADDKPGRTASFAALPPAAGADAAHSPGVAVR